MSKNNFQQKNQDVDYYKSLNRIMVLGLSGMAAIGTSMLIAESAKVNASMLLKARNILNPLDSSTIIRKDAFKPKKSKRFLPLDKRLITKNKFSVGSLLSEIEKSQSNSNKDFSKKNKLPIITPTGEKQNSLKSKK